MKTIAIIPARSGSKGLKDKNIKPLAGKPLLAYSIDTAVDSKLFDTVMVSTDSERYAEFAIEHGAEVPFLRSQRTASDEATTRECVLEVLEEYEKRDRFFERMMILQPTSPLRTVDDIIQAERLYQEKDAKSVISVCEMDHPPLWSNTISSTLSLDHFIRAENSGRRQIMDVFYRINGAIYLHDIEHYKKNEYYFDNKAFAYIMKKEHSVDIDDELDFKFAELLMKEGNKYGEYL
ncbi:acylneuraminate cytidylyltransferase family protein [Clostridiales bacterium]|nr:acylneuraminate cytidylyltransferase family protein [Clostridiales bacterium]